MVVIQLSPAVVKIGQLGCSLPSKFTDIKKGPPEHISISDLKLFILRRLRHGFGFLFLKMGCIDLTT